MWVVLSGQHLFSGYHLLTLLAYTFNYCLFYNTMLYSDNFVISTQVCGLNFVSNAISLPFLLLLLYSNMLLLLYSNDSYTFLQVVRYNKAFGSNFPPCSLLRMQRPSVFLSIHVSFFAIIKSSQKKNAGPKIQTRDLLGQVTARPRHYPGIQDCFDSFMALCLCFSSVN